LEFNIVRSYSAVLDDQVGSAGNVDQFSDVTRSLIDDNIGILNLTYITMLLALVNVRLGKGHLMTKIGKIAIDATIVCSRAIPVGGCNARSKYKNPHRLNSP